MAKEVKNNGHNFLSTHDVNYKGINTYNIKKIKGEIYNTYGESVDNMKSQKYKRLAEEYVKAILDIEVKLFINKTEYKKINPEKLKEDDDLVKLYKMLTKEHTDNTKLKLNYITLLLKLIDENTVEEDNDTRGKNAIMGLF